MFIGIKSLSSFYTLTSVAIKIQLSNIIFGSSIFSLVLLRIFLLFISRKKLCHNILVNVFDVNVPWTVSMFPSIAVKLVKISVNLQVRRLTKSILLTKTIFLTVRQQKKNIETAMLNYITQVIIPRSSTYFYRTVQFSRLFFHSLSLSLSRSLHSLS